MGTRRQPDRATPQPAESPATVALARICENRALGRGQYVATLAADMDYALRELTRHRRAVGGAAVAWESVVPRELAARTTLENITRGVLTVRVPDAATSFELDRFLRAGGTRALKAACRVSITRVRVVVKS